MSPERRKTLSEAVKEIGDLYLEDRLANLLGTQLPEERDEFWQQAAEEFSSFKKNIESLRKALKDAETIKNAYPQIEKVMSLRFAGVEDEGARYFLTDILLARTMERPGYIDYSLVNTGGVVKESEMMMKELGIDNPKSEEAKRITLDMVVEGVLTGTLQLSRQVEK